MALRYKQVEASLADVFEVKPKKLGAFKARLRHLRNLGVPDLPKPGSGAQIDYEPEQVLAMLVALQLQAMGNNPRTVAQVANEVVRRWYRPRPLGTSIEKLGDLFVIIQPEKDDRFHAGYGAKVLAEFLKIERAFGFSVINVSACAEGLFSALEKLGE